MCTMYLDSKVHAIVDLLDLVQQGINSYPQTPQTKGKGKGSSRAPKTSTKTTFTNQSATKQGTSLQQQEVDKDSSVKDKREDRNNQQGQRTGRDDTDYSGSDTSSDSGSSSTSSIRSILCPQNNNQYGQCVKSVEQEEQELTTGISIPSRQKKMSK